MHRSVSSSWWFLVLALSVLLFTSCTTSHSPASGEERPTYTVGATGPAGGIVFYDKGEYSDGWRYFEVAPAGSETLLPWSNDQFHPNTQTAIGSGAANTDLIASFDSGSGNSAAVYCTELTIKRYSDWILPSKDELNLLFSVLGRTGKETFLKEGFAYWSSSSFDAWRAWGQGFSNGVQGRVEKQELLAVRAIRAF